MLLDQYHSRSGSAVQITEQQASSFAKDVSGDFNPIHDPGSKNFCVPGDLLFALVLSKFGLQQKMNFTFTGMVKNNVELVFPEHPGQEFEILDRQGKSYLRVERHGESADNAVMVENLIRRYVAFSGQNFPHILVPLMAEHNIMINPRRPLVIYDSMSFNLDRLDFKEIGLELSNTTLEIKGKRAEARLYFSASESGRPVGSGFKKLILSGLREYDQDVIQQLSNGYLASKAAYESSQEPD